MAITACPVTPTFAAEIGDVDLSRKIDPNSLAAIEDRVHEVRGLDLPRSASLPRTSASISPSNSGRLKPRSPFIGRMHSYACARSLPTFPISITTMRCGERTAGSACSS